MRIKLAAAAIGAIAFLASPALAQDSGQGQAAADDAANQLDKSASDDPSNETGVESGKPPKDVFPDSTKIPEPDPDFGGDSDNPG